MLTMHASFSVGHVSQTFSMPNYNVIFNTLSFKLHAAEVLTIVQVSFQFEFLNFLF